MATPARGYKPVKSRMCCCNRQSSESTARKGRGDYQAVHCVYEQQTEYRDQLREQSKEKIAVLVELAQRLRKHKGKKVYGYLSAPSERLPRSQNPEFKPIRNVVVKAALGIDHQEKIQTEEYKAGAGSVIRHGRFRPRPCPGKGAHAERGGKRQRPRHVRFGPHGPEWFRLCEGQCAGSGGGFRKTLATFIAEESRSKNPGYWQYRIGKMYAMGYGAEQDYCKAAGWYEKAVDEKNPFAAYALGSLYRWR